MTDAMFLGAASIHVALRRVRLRVVFGAWRRHLRRDFAREIPRRVDFRWDDLSHYAVRPGAYAALKNGDDVSPPRHEEGPRFPAPGRKGRRKSAPLHEKTPDSDKEPSLCFPMATSMAVRHSKQENANWLNDEGTEQKWQTRKRRAKNTVSMRSIRVTKMGMVIVLLHRRTSRPAPPSLPNHHRASWGEASGRKLLGP